jgi:thioesterase domain-containing protein
MTPREIEQYFRDKIPLTRAMVVRVESWSDGKLILSAPLEANHNHLGTAFGGSLNALAMLAGYGLIWLSLGDANAHVVVRRGTANFLKPVRGELRAACQVLGEAEMEAFRQRFLASGKARITLLAVIETEEGAAVEFEGEYVALREKH